jgi:uncharacterized protein DUF6570/helitron helicase-like protein
MESKYCSRCAQLRPLSSFHGRDDRVLSTCINCRTQQKVAKEDKNGSDRARREVVEAERVRTTQLRNERLEHIQQNIGGGNSRHGMMAEGRTAAGRPTATVNDRSFSPDTADRIPSCLEEEFPRFATATENFPPEITKENIRERYNDYQRRIDWCADRSPCGICGGSFQSNSVTLYSQEKLIELDNQHELDSCAVHDGGVYLCNTCGHDLELNGRMSVPKISGANWVNKSLCQHQPSVFDDLTLVERQVIARCHLVGYIIRLSGGTNADVSYRGARGHIVAFKQDPSELLSILPSPDLRLSSVITVSWDGAVEPSRENLRKFCAIRKRKVAQALYWLCRHNPLWRDHVTVNEELLQSWPEEFIPDDLLENAVRTEPGLSDNREGYAMDRNEILQGDSDEMFENDVDRLSRDANPGTVVTGAFLQDPEGSNDSWRERHAALFAELEAAHNEAANEKALPLPHIKYRSAFGVEILSSWLNEIYLLAAFPDLFPHGEGGHFQPDKSLRPIPVSLEEFAKWAMTHHSHRFARHPIFPYVLYDMILLRQSTVGNFLQSRKDYWVHAQADIFSVSSDELRMTAVRMKDGGKCENPTIQRLLNNMRLISTYNPESFGRKLAKRHQLFGQIVRFGIPAIWFTINPSDLKNPVVLRVAGVDIHPHMERCELNRLRRLHAIGNPTIVAQYFHFVVESFFKKLLCTDSGKIGILGDISNHFAVVEENNRHMLHLHGFAWVTGNMIFTKLQDRVLADLEFRNRLVSYLQTAISEVVDEMWADEYKDGHPDLDRFVDNPNDSTEQFWSKMEADSNYVFSRCQIHRHTFTCFKYGKRKAAENRPGTSKWDSLEGGRCAKRKFRVLYVRLHIILIVTKNRTEI